MSGFVHRVPDVVSLVLHCRNDAICIVLRRYAVKFAKELVVQSMVSIFLLLQSPVEKTVLERTIRVKKEIGKLNHIYNQPDFYLGRFARNIPASDTLTYCIIALRVEFQKEEPDDSLTTGDGTFDTTSYGIPGTFTYKPPYDSLYFVSLMEFAKQYYEDITFGRIRFSYLVLPVVRVPHTIRYYGDYQFFGQGITSFFRDAIRAVDEQTDIVFSDLIYDCPNSTGLVFPRILIFFAGGAYQTDVRGDSPYDLPAVTIYSGALDYYLGEPYIIANGGRDTIYDATLMPMTMSQDSVVIGVHGTLVHELNHLMFFTNDVYDYNFLGTGAGYYDLMATGGYGGDIRVSYPDTTLYVPEGFLPTRPGAYTLLYMDSIQTLICPTCQRIVEPSEVVDIHSRNASRAVNYTITPPSGTPSYYRVWLDPDEYYLIEFRKRELVEDSVVNFIWNDDSTLIYGVYDGEWDFSLPGEGLLVWHIDENIIDSMGWEHQSARPMGVDLMEADGVQDFEYYYGNFTAWWKGTPYDPYWSGNRDMLDETTFPSTLSNERKRTGWRIFSISPVSTTMSFSIENTLQSGYFHPFGTNYRFSRTFVVPHDVDGDGNQEAVVLMDVHVDTVDPQNLQVNLRSMLVVVDSSARPLVAERTFIRGAQYFWYDYVFHYPPLVYDFNGNGSAEIYLGSVDGKIYAYEVTSSLTPVSGYPISMGYPVRGCLRRVGPYILAGLDDGNLVLVDPLTGSVESSFNTHQPATACPLVVSDTIYYQSPDGIFYVLDGNLNLLSSTPLENLPNPTNIMPVLVNGRIYTATENYLWILDRDLNVLKRVPIEALPLEMSFASDGILLFTAGGVYLYGFDGSLKGKLKEEGLFGVSAPGPMVGPYEFDYSWNAQVAYPAILSANGNYYYIFADAKGNVYSYRLDEAEVLVSSYYDRTTSVEVAGGPEVSPYVYPNPVPSGVVPIVRFSASAGERVRIMVLDFSGRKVLEKTYDVPMDGIQEVPIEADYMRGAYFVIVEGKGRAKFFVKGR